MVPVVDDSYMKAGSIFTVSQSNSVHLKVMDIGPKQYKMQNKMNKTDFYVTPERFKTGHHYGNGS